MHKAYAGWMALTWGIACLFALAINLAVDPLWYHEGNMLTGVNFAFNERQAKMNQLLRNPASYDCLIFGSSRSTLLPASEFGPYHCFNLSFSGGQIGEFVAFAEYIRDAGIRPKLIIIGVDGFNFLEGQTDPLSIPDYITQKEAPPGFIKTYLSVDSLLLSWRTLRGKSPLPRYYNNRFEALIRTDAPPFRPEMSLETEGLKRTDAKQRDTRRFQPQRADLYKQLVSIFPGARSIAYVPPVSAWHIGVMEKNGSLQSYLDALYATSRHFSVLIDFSIPSAITWQTNNTYDGSHYSVLVNRHIAHILLARDRTGWGVNLNELDEQSYSRRYKEAITNFYVYTDGQGQKK